MVLCGCQGVATASRDVTVAVPNPNNQGVNHPWPSGLNSAGKPFVANLAPLFLPLILMGHSGLKDIKRSWRSKRPASYQTYHGFATTF